MKFDIVNNSIFTKSNKFHLQHSFHDFKIFKRSLNPNDTTT